MDYFSKKVTDYITKNHELSDINNAKIKYSIEVILSEIFKLILLLLMFNMIGELRTFMYAFITLLLFRPLLGGLHLDSFISCYIFTMLFFQGSIFLANAITVGKHFLGILFIFNLIIIIKFRLISLLDKHTYTKIQIILHTNIPAIALCTHFLGYALKNDSLYFKISIWTITLQSTQLIIAKGVSHYEKRKQNKTN